MQTLCYFAIVNAILATGLAVCVWCLSRWIRRPALLHLLWVLVLVRLVMPPIVIFQVTGLRSWLAAKPTTVVVSQAWAVVHDVASQPQRSLAVLRVALQHTSILPQLSILPAGRSEHEATPSRLIPVTQTMGLGTSLRRGMQRCAVAVVQQGGRILNWWVPLWLTGSIVFVVVQVVMACRFRARLRKQAYSSRIWQQRAQRVATQMGLGSCPSVLLVRDQVPPMLWGFAPRTYILFPDQLLLALSTHAQDTLLAHELAHYRRGDQWVRMLELLVATLFWWHPVVWWARHHLEAAEEECADAWAVKQSAGQPRTYAEALLAAVDFVSVGIARLPPAASGVGGQLLRRRLTAIMSPRRAELALAPDGYMALLLVACLALPPCPAVWNLAGDESPGDKVNGGNLVAPVASSDVGPAWGRNRGLKRPVSMQDAPIAVVTASGFSLTMDIHRRVRLRADGRQFNLGVGRVAAVDFLSDEASLVLGGFDDAIEVVDCQTGHVQQRIQLGLSAITSVAVSPGKSPDRGRLIAAGSRDGICRLVDFETGQIRIVQAETAASVRSVRFSGNGRYLAITFDQSTGSRVDVWNLSENQRVGRLVTTERILAVSPQTSAAEWLLVYEDGVCNEWSTAAHTLSPSWQVPATLVPRLAFAPINATSLKKLLSDF